MSDELNMRPEPLPLKKLLKEKNIKLWQVVRRFLSKGIHITEPVLSLVLNGIDQPSDQLKAQLKQIEGELKKLNTPNEKIRKRLKSIKEEIRALETQIDPY